VEIFVGRTMQTFMESQQFKSLYIPNSQKVEAGPRRWVLFFTGYT